jgi:predicted ferric reductase
MNEQIWWYTARASGLVSFGLAAAAIIWGLLYSSRIMEGRPTLRWTLDLHKYLGALTVAFVGVHMAALFLDTQVQFGLRELLIPFASSWRPGAVAMGIVAAYLLVAIQISSLMMKRLPRKLWRVIHLTSYAVFGLGLVHGIQAGSDFSHPAIIALAIGLTTFISYLTAFRVMGPHTKRAPKKLLSDAA